MEICVFAGPTRLRNIPSEVHVFEPAALGSVFRAVQAGYKTICLIDGYFGNMPSVWHKEILFALKKGVTVCGAASTGALRAAELHAYGMVGFGWVYRAFRRGLLQDDDEVCVIHAVPELNFHPLSEAMVNIRYSLATMRRYGHIDREAETRMTSHLKTIHFSERNDDAIRVAFEHAFGARGTTKFELYEARKVDIKSLDAELMLRAAVSASIAQRSDAWTLPVTNHWLSQFLVGNADIPQLSRWHPVPHQVAGTI
jgi:hypothetical protein